VDKLNIDQSFVRNLASDSDDAAIVRAIIQMGHSLKLSTIAEGVETQAQLAFLSAAGCREGQGYLFGRPVGADEMQNVLISAQSAAVVEPIEESCEPVTNG
jgi:EAL domain-containing protein (putative c-di-GMP-specific phosphodiesterase class I)